MLNSGCQTCQDPDSVSGQIGETWAFVCFLVAEGQSLETPLGFGPLDSYVGRTSNRLTKTGICVPLLALCSM